MELWILCFSIYGLVRGQDAEFQEPTLKQCCEDGRDQALGGHDCAIMPLLSSSHICRIAQEQCCAEVVTERLCSVGMDMAREQLACESPFFQGVPWETRVSKTCCDCCMLGLMAVGHSQSCDLGLSLGKQCLHAAKTCCGNNSTEEAAPPATRAPVTTTATVTSLGDAVTSSDAAANNDTSSNAASSNVTASVVPTSVVTTTPEKEKDFCQEHNCSHLCVEGACACRHGYRLKADGLTCEDVNECLIGVHGCVPGQVCINTDGSFRCQRKISCGTGYQLTDDNQCQDIDECALGTHYCGVSFACNNTLGSFRCHPKERCGVGFIQDAIGSCIDVNECVSRTSPCRAGQTCVNTVGSYTCLRNMVTCGRGYRLIQDGTRCEDVDECRVGDACVGHSCVNLIGTHRCECRAGFVFNSNTKHCEDINECRHYPGRLCAHKCDNTEGSYHCSCTTGFKLSNDGRNCNDVNECEDNPCSQECANVYGSYQCYCRRGYQLSDSDGTTCEDIDECALPTGGHICSYRCVNSPGSFSCTCPPTGYTLAANGRSCQDVDECATGTHTCSVTESCFNIQGGFRCLSFDCPHNFRRASEGQKNVRSVGVRCVKACQPRDVVCAVDPVRLITHTVISLPTYRDFTAAEDIVFLRTTVPNNPLPGATNVFFDIVASDSEHSFDVEKRIQYDLITGVIRQVKPIVGPRDVVVEVAMNYIKSGIVSHRNIVVIHVFVSEFWF